MRVSVLLLAPVSALQMSKHAFFSRRSSLPVGSGTSPDSKGAWHRTCKDMAGIISPYYTPGKDDETRVVCVPSLCGEKFVGRTTDFDTSSVDFNSKNAIPKCAQKKGMAESCCTDKVKDDNLCRVGGSLPCFFGKVKSLEAYTEAAVDTFNAQKAAGVSADCQGKPGGEGPEDDFKADAAKAQGTGTGESPKAQGTGTGESPN